MKCQNRNLIHQHPELVLFLTTNETGIGVTCKKDIKYGEYVASYLGELFHKEDSDWKEQKAKYNKPDSEYYQFEFTEGFLIDTYRQGNYTAFINHSCIPNCEIYTWDHQGYDRVFIHAIKDIPAFTELTYHYKL